MASVKKDKKIEVPVEILVPKAFTTIKNKSVTLVEDKLVEVPQERVFEKVKEKVVGKEVKLPCERIVERIIEVPVTKTIERIVERVIEVPIEKTIEKVVTVTATKFVEKLVEKVVKIQKTVPIFKTVEKKVEVIVVNTIVKRVEVPYDRIVEKVVEVPIEQIVEKRVEVPYEKVIEKTVHIKNDVIVEKIVEIEVDEEIVEIPVYQEMHHVATAERVTLEDQGLIFRGNYISSARSGTYRYDYGRVRNSPVGFLADKKVNEETAKEGELKDTTKIVEISGTTSPKVRSELRYDGRGFIAPASSVHDSRQRVEEFLRMSPSPATQGRIVRQYFVPPSEKYSRPLSPVASVRSDV